MGTANMKENVFPVFTKESLTPNVLLHYSKSPACYVMESTEVAVKCSLQPLCVLQGSRVGPLYLLFIFWLTSIPSWEFIQVRDFATLGHLYS